MPWPSFLKDCTGAIKPLTEGNKRVHAFAKGIMVEGIFV